MTQVKHTPGPWNFDKDDLGTWINSYTHPEPIAKMGSSSNFPIEANAKLIAAAPTMYNYILSKANAGDAEAKEIIKTIYGS
jgi:hypothetical protein